MSPASSGCKTLAAADGVAVHRRYRGMSYSGRSYNGSQSQLRGDRHLASGLDRLAQAKAYPLFVEDAIRTALSDTIAWRIGGGAAPNADAFAAAAVVSARQALDAVAADFSQRSRMLSAVHTAAKRFTAAALGRRLLTIPAAQFVRLARKANGADAIVRDRRRRLHAIVLRFAPDALDAGRTATAVANATPLSSSDRLTALSVHVFSLTTGRRQTFEREVVQVQVASRVA